MQLDASLQQILSQKDLVAEHFYELFLDRHADVRRLFAAVDMKHQSVMLTMALMMVEAHYSHSYPATEHYLKVLGHRHHQMGVKPELYVKFRDCLLAALEVFHADDWDQHLAGQWRKAIEKATATMLEGYERDYIY